MACRFARRQRLIFSRRRVTVTFYRPGSVSTIWPPGDAPLSGRGLGNAALATVVFAIVAVVLAVPAMFMFAAAAVAFPIAIQVAIAFVPRPDPTCAGINRTGPVAGMPSIVASHRIPIAFNPNILRAGPRRLHAHHARGRWRADLNAHGHLAEKGSCNHKRR
jgi:hypothetical protein